jgi:hypothetical protein
MTSTAKALVSSATAPTSECAGRDTLAATVELDNLIVRDLLVRAEVASIAHTSTSTAEYL